MIVDLTRNDLGRVLTETAWEARGADTPYVWLPRKVAMESSSSCHHGVW
jgi:anthranilate/para-aminobenzoate synthase component I